MQGLNNLSDPKNPRPLELERCLYCGDHAVNVCNCKFMQIIVHCAHMEISPSLDTLHDG